MNLPHKVSIHFGKIIHHRYAPVNHFSYSTFYLRIPMRTRRLDPALLAHHGIADNRFSWLSFYDKDHGDQERQSLDWIEHLLTVKNCTGVDGEIWLHTFPRILGFVFNPVSFWFCHDSQGLLKAIVAEVNNTFGERHAYLLQSTQDNSLRWGQDLVAPKLFHVSPFFDVIGNYRFRFMQQTVNTVSPKFVSRIDYFQDNRHHLMTSVSGTAYPLNGRSKLRAMVSFPLLTFSVLLKIHWQAVKLWSKGAKFYKKPKPPEIPLT